MTQEPHSRFYAGTPLTSGSGINLGCLFVLDSEPRQGLSDIEKDTLGKVAELAMDYLLVSRQAAAIVWSPSFCRWQLQFCQQRSHIVSFEQPSTEFVSAGIASPQSQSIYKLSKR